MARLLLALVVAFGLTAFAPAPFPRGRASADAVSLQSCQGTWEVVRKESVSKDGRQAFNSGIKFIRIQNDRWTLIDAKGQDMVSYTIAINGTVKPARIDWFPLGARPGEAKALWVGLVKRDGAQVQILYADPNSPSRDFEAIAPGSYLYTVRRGEVKR